MTTFVTGGHGFIGHHVVRRLLEKGHVVRSLVRESSRPARLEGLDVELVVGDVRDPAALRKGMAGCNACFHLAAIVAWADLRSGALVSTIVDGTRNVVEAACESDDMRLVYVSSAAAINGSRSPRIFDEGSCFELGDGRLEYAQAKHEAERLVREAARGRGLDAVVVNPVEVYGPGDDSFVTAGNIRDILRLWPAVSFAGGASIAHVEDVADGIVAAFERGVSGERYILGGDNLTIDKIVRLTLELGSVDKPVVPLPGRPLLWLLRALARLHLPTPISPDLLEYATHYFFFDSSRAKRALGYTPRGAREVLAPVVEWLRSERLV